MGMCVAKKKYLETEKMAQSKDQELKKVQEILSESERKNQTLSKENQSLQSQMIEKKQQNDSKEKEINNLNQLIKQQKDSKEKEINDLNQLIKQQKHSKEKEINNLNQLLKQKEQEINNLKTQLMKQKDVKEMPQDHQQYIEDIVTLTNRVKDYEVTIQALQYQYQMKIGLKQESERNVQNLSVLYPKFHDPQTLKSKIDPKQFEEPQASALALEQKKNQYLNYRAQIQQASGSRNISIKN